MAVNPTTPPALTTARPVVLVADDCTLHRTATTAMLERAGFDTVAVADGSAAVEAVARRNPELMVLDAVMPTMSGFEAIAAIRSRPEYATVPAIVVSGLDDIQSRLDAFAIGADDFITKPVVAEELVARVRALLRVADVWSGRVGGLIARFGEIRQRIEETQPSCDPIETARAIQRLFPDEVGCSTFRIVAPDGVEAWTDAPPAAVANALARPGVADASRPVVAAHGHARCPLCGSRGDDRVVLAAAAGRWENGTAQLLIGCVRVGDRTAFALAGEIAAACTAVLSESARERAERAALRARIDDVLEVGGFDAHFQPIVDMCDGRILAFEALARFDDGTRPDVMFDAAASVDRMAELEIATARRAVERARGLPPGIEVHVNVSPTTATRPELAEILAASDRPITLEVTENEPLSPNTAERIRATLPPDSSLAVDDVGAGYAGLNLLLAVRPDIIKIDRAIVSSVHHDPARQAIVAGLVQFARSIGATTVAEGIELVEEAETLLHLGINRGQGYLFARPQPVGEAATAVVAGMKVGPDVCGQIERPAAPTTMTASST